MVLQSSLSLRNIYKGASLLLVRTMRLLGEATETRWRETTHEHIAANWSLREAKSTLSCCWVDSSCHQLLLLPEHLLLHLSVHLLLPKHLLIDHLLLFGSEDVGTWGSWGWHRQTERRNGRCTCESTKWRGDLRSC